MSVLSRVAYCNNVFDPAIIPSTTADARLVTDHEEVPISRAEPGSRVLSTNGQFYELVDVLSIVVKWDQAYRPIHLPARALGNRNPLWLSPACSGAIETLNPRVYPKNCDAADRENALGQRVVTEGQGALWITYYTPVFNENITAVVDGLPLPFVQN